MMDKSYIKSDEETTLLGLWVLFFTLSIIFLWLIYEIYVSLNYEPTYRWESSFNIVGLPYLTFVFLLLFFVTKNLIKKYFFK